MAEVTKEDLNRLYDIVEPMREDIAAIKTRIELMPSQRRRPCPDFEQHIREHRELQQNVRQMLLNMIPGMIKLAAAAALGALLGAKIL